MTTQVVGEIDSFEDGILNYRISFGLKIYRIDYEDKKLGSKYVVVIQQLEDAEYSGPSVTNYSERIASHIKASYFSLTHFNPPYDWKRIIWLEHYPKGVNGHTSDSYDIITYGSFDFYQRRFKDPSWTHISESEALDIISGKEYWNLLVIV